MFLLEKVGRSTAVADMAPACARDGVTIRRTIFPPETLIHARKGYDERSLHLTVLLLVLLHLHLC
jgi:hypothetical protein